MTTIILELNDCELEYDLVDTPVSRIWVQQIRELTANTVAPGYCRKLANSWLKRSYVDNQYLVDRINGMLGIMGHGPIEGTPESLNTLHREFQLVGHAGGFQGLWAQINILIHQAEFTSPWPQAHMGCYADYGPDLDRPLITPELRPYWGYFPQNGDLCLGYHTIGKDLATAYRDNDTELVSKLLLEPQRQISPEIVAYLGKMNLRFNVIVDTEIRTWLDANNLSDKVDLSDPAYQYHGHPILGRLIKNTNTEEMLAWLREDHKIKAVRIWD